MTRFTKDFLLFFTVILLVLRASETDAQRVSINVTDSGVMEDAVIRVVPLAKASKEKVMGGLTNKMGNFTFNYTEPVSVHINYLGYVAIVDTMLGAEDRSYHLRKNTANIEDVVVTGQYAPGSAKASVYSVSVLNAKDFREKGATNLREALQGGLGIDMSQDPVFGSGISLNGISGEGVKIMIDGIPLVGRQNGVLDISQINLSNIERVEVIKGPMSAMYGSDAMGGVVNLISKTNQKEKIDINLKGYYESVGQYNADLNVGLHFGKSQVFLSGGRNFFDGYSTIADSRRQDWLPKEQYYGTAKYIYTASKFKVGASLSFMRELMLDRGDLLPQTTYAFDQHYLTMRPLASVFTHIPVRDYSKIDLSIAYSGYVRFTNYYKKDLVTLEETLHNDPLYKQDTAVYHTLAARGTYTLTSHNKKISSQFGVDINQEYTTQGLIPGGTKAIGDYAVFGSVMIRPVAGLDIQPALRFGYNTQFNSPVIPSLNIKYDFLNHFIIRASYGRGYRAPSLKELYMVFVDGTHHIEGNPLLQPEDGHSAILSFGYRGVKKEHHYSVSLRGFYNTISNKIDLLLIPNNIYAAYGKYFNIDNFVSAGADLQGEYGWRGLTVGASTSLTYYNIVLHASQASSSAVSGSLLSPDFNATVGYKIPKIKTSTKGARIMAAIVEETTISFMYKYTGKKSLSGLNGNNEYGLGYASSFNTLDFSLSRNFWKDRIQVTAGGKNLFNVSKVETVGVQASGHINDPNHMLVGWGRTFFISLNLHFAK